MDKPEIDKEKIVERFKIKIYENLLKYQNSLIDVDRFKKKYKKHPDKYRTKLINATNKSEAIRKNLDKLDRYKEEYENQIKEGSENV